MCRIHCEVRLPVSSIGILPEPSALGLPERFSDWRPGQEDAALRAVESTKRFVVLALPTGSGKSLAYLAAAQLSGERTAFLTSTKGLQNQLCLAPETKVLTSTFRWIPIGDLKCGDVVMGFDEYLAPTRRYWKPSRVLSVRWSKRPAYVLFLEDGTTVTATADHQWLCRSWGGQSPWITTSNLRVEGKYASHLSKIVDVWETDQSYQAGYLAAAFDGEGHLTQRRYRKGDGRDNGVSVGLFFSQVKNEMLERVKEYLYLKKFRFSKHLQTRTNPKHRNCEIIEVGHRRDIIRFLGQIRPVRLLGKVKLDLFGMIGPVRRVKVIGREYIGTCDMVDISTTSKTFVAEGFATHNCSDFQSSGLLDIRGQNNYPCLYHNGTEPRRAGEHARLGGNQSAEHGHTRGHASPAFPSAEMPTVPTLSCDEGPCHGGVRCELKESGCVYFDRVRLARQVTLVSTNYSYWMHQMENGGGLGPFSMLVLDEAHDALDQLSNYLAVELFPSDLDILGEDRFPEHNAFEPWKVCSRVWLDRARSQRESLEAAVKAGLADGDSRRAVHQAKHLKKLERKLAQLSSAQGDWVFQVTRRGPSGSLVARFDPVWPADYAERRLFCGIKRVVLTSATIRPKTLELLGIGHGDVDFQEYPSSFPVGRRPVYFVPSVRMDKRATPGHMRAWISKIDAIIRPRLKGKGIIHAVSYQRAQWIARNSEFAGHMFVHNTGTARETIAKFKEAVPPAILVSPSVSTGFDFPDDECRWQILCKVPFPDTRDLVTKARSDRDRDYPMYQAMQEIVQMAGRSTRSEDDWSEVLIVDDHFEWFWPKFKKFAPKWFAEAVELCKVIPKPLEK